MAKTFGLGSLIAFKTASGVVALGNVVNDNLPAGDGGVDLNLVRTLDVSATVEVISDNCKLICGANEVS